MKFSERNGLVPRALLREDMDDGLRNQLWNVILSKLFGKLTVDRSGVVTSEYHVFIQLWKSHFKYSMDDFERRLKDRKEWLWDEFRFMEWNQVFDLFEFIAVKMIPFDYEEFARETNQVLEESNSAYRFVERVLVPVHADPAVMALQDGLGLLTDYEFLRTGSHFRQALLALKTDAPAAVEQCRQAVRAGVEELLEKCGTPTSGDALATLLDDPSWEVFPTVAASMHALSAECARAGAAEAAYVLVQSVSGLHYLVEKAIHLGRLERRERKAPEVPRDNPWAE